MQTFRLEVTVADSSQYRIAILDHDANQVLAEETFAKAGVEAAVWAPAKIRQFFDGDDARQPNAKLQAIGEQLADWLFPPAVRAELDAVRGPTVRVWLDVQAPDLASLPWELVRSGPLPDFLDVQMPFARMHRGPSIKARCEWPLRVMIVVGAPELNDVGAEEEIAAIERRLHPYGHSIDREILRRPAKAELAPRLESFRPHVLLFIGHCDTDALVNAAVLRFQLTPPGVSWNWTPADVALDLNKLRWTPCLVILNACRTHDADASFKLADAFVRSGTPAAITMQGDVRGDLAGHFSARVLSGLCHGEAIDTAVAEARSDLRRFTNVLQRDWAFPVLSLATAPEALLEKRPVSARKDAIAAAFREICWFVDRRTERRLIRSELRVSGAGGKASGLLVIVGPARSGKSHLAKWCLEEFALLHDSLVRYVPAAGTGNDDFVAVLRRIRDPMFAGQDAFTADALNAFHWRLNALLAGLPPTEWGGQPVPDEGRRYDPQAVNADNPIRDVCSAFADLLRAAAAERHVVIVLDQFVNGSVSLEPSVMKDALVPHLLVPAREGRLPGVQFVLVIDTPDAARYGVDTLVPSDRWIRVEPDLPEPRERLEHELFWYPDAAPVEDNLRSMIELVARRMQLQPRSCPRIDYIQALRRAARGVFAQSDDPQTAEDDLRNLFKIRQMM